MVAKSLRLERQIKKHQFTEYVDYESQKVGRAIEYRFTLNAANHVLLTAMTQQGKDARELAIGLVQDTLEDNQLGINPESAYVGIARFMAGYDDGKKTKWKESYKAVINNKGVYQATVEFIESTSSKAVNGLRKEDRAELLHKAESFIKLEKTTYRKTSDDFNITEYNDYDKACLLLSNRRNRVLSRRVTELTK
ncbi:hypothetical protein [Photobacterium leiognathi]|uniref:hypothetical protein n=1 Tax=Photobacterium leiognathi TaxID=553611 RepID=UPI002981D730|nr:hypothetical protein [Photobacterium leiognathi]